MATIKYVKREVGEIALELVYYFRIVWLAISGINYNTVLCLLIRLDHNDDGA